MAFSERFEKLPFTKDWDLMTMVEHVQRMEFGSTDCAQPMIWAAKQRKMFDAFIVFTDNETYFGKVGIRLRCCHIA
jgi:60 kDa SS-A/Ro ribonucleoprotein